MPKTTEYHEKLRPFVHHGVDLPNDPKQASGTCPFCGKSKFSVKTETGQYRCLVCENAGNISTFLQSLYTESLSKTTDDDLEHLVQLRPATSAAGFRYYGIARSIITDEWLAPMFNNKGVLANLVRFHQYVENGKTKFLPLSTPGCKLWPFGVKQFLDNPRPNLFIAEGFWDMVALFDQFSQNRLAGGKLIKSTNPATVLSATHSIIAAPGSGTWQADWFEFTAGRNTSLLFDNDHPVKDDNGEERKKSGQPIRPGWDGMQRIVNLAQKETKNRPKALNVLHWAEAENKSKSPPTGHNHNLPSGYDLRDAILGGKLAGLLLGHLIPAPLSSIPSPKNGSAPTDAPPVEPIERTSFKALVQDFRDNLHFTKAMEDVLAVMLATVTSTKFPVEGQLWFRVIGPPGSGKTTLAEAVSAAREWVAPKSILTGFHSGYIDYGADGEPKKDASLLHRLNGMTVVMKDADTLLASPAAGKIMSELRDIFDGASRSEYRNKVADGFEDLRMTFILCGTNALRTMDRSYLGERFLDIEIMKAGEDHTPLLDRASKNTYNSMTQFMQALTPKVSENGEATDEVIPVNKSKFLKQVTYGFIKHFEENFKSLKPPIIPPAVQTQIEAMAEFVAHMRARVQREGRSDDVLYRQQIEVPSRLVQQLTRLPFCLALILGKEVIDNEVLDITRKVMIDTSCGFQFEIAEQLAKLGPHQGMSVNNLARILTLSDSTVRRLADDMTELGVLATTKMRNNSGQRGRSSHLLSLSDKMRSIWKLAMGGSVPVRTSTRAKAPNPGPKPVRKK